LGSIPLDDSAARRSFVVVAAGRCLFRYDDLLKLADLVEKVR
jgi:hypothetical protein